MPGKQKDSFEAIQYSFGNLNSNSELVLLFPTVFFFFPSRLKLDQRAVFLHTLNIAMFWFLQDQEEGES